MLKEQFVPDTVLMYVARGAIQTYDGNQRTIFRAGEYGIAQKNRLVKYELVGSETSFEPVIFCFGESFLQAFKNKHQIEAQQNAFRDAFIRISSSPLINSFMDSIKPYYKGAMELEAEFEDIKYEELLIILLKEKPELADVLFDFRKPGKIDLEKFMVKNFTFNVNIDQFATLTGRSLSAFKRDFKEIFGESPSRWLVKKRLAEAYFLIDKKRRKPNDIYLDLGFESLSHFSVAFKKQFGQTPTQLATDDNS